MRYKLEINSDFIADWEPKYDDIEKDEEEYKNIINYVKNDIYKINTLSLETFYKILVWKKSIRGSKKAVNWDNFIFYQKTFEEVLKLPEDDKIESLFKLGKAQGGIGIPTASAILHFIYPNTFPIMDYRTAEILYYADYIESKYTQSVYRYYHFKCTLLEIIINNPEWSLRQLDRALFGHWFSLMTKHNMLIFIP